jgi:hypothetical protein
MHIWVSKCKNDIKINYAYMISFFTYDVLMWNTYDYNFNYFTKKQLHHFQNHTILLVAHGNQKF